MGLFDRSSAGHRTWPVAVVVERGPLLFFAETIGETDPLCLDPAAARTAGLPDIVAPPTYAAALDRVAVMQAAREDQPDILALIGADMRYLLHGSESYDYHAPIHAGETVEHVTTRDRLLPTRATAGSNSPISKSRFAASAVRAQWIAALPARSIHIHRPPEVHGRPMGTGDKTSLPDHGSLKQRTV
ncbi:MAG: MaoC family dehydratase N-terminal domain-containing protein [Paracoccaceae bacterium]